ncbi:MAG: FKBP-type peptidyl-prolyl cis-trans isomerase [Bacteroidales bacterium]
MLVLPALFLVISCSERGGGNTGGIVVPDREAVEEANRYLVQKDRERIENYIERRGLDMQMTRSGLWYMITDTGAGNPIQADDRILINYNCGLLDGTEVYSSADKGPREIVIGRTNTEAGLDEGLRMLRGGSKALFIIPSYLAHGLLGDGEKIPPRAVVVYSIMVIRHNNIDY